jgi:glycosyltransferase involved in cell wall biosynthesis
MTSISVVIPALNDASMLRVCLAALATQRRAADEVIVVDNGSTDDTADVARAAGARVVTEPVRGIYPATSAGYDAATGDVIARLDADSIPGPDWLERIERDLANLPPLTAVTGGADFYGAGPVVHWLGRVVYVGGMYWSINHLLGHPPVFGSNFAMPAEIWRRLRDTANRTVVNIHDDLDLSWHFEPDMDIVYDPSLRVQISARPFSSAKALGRRLGWVYTTLSLDFAEQSPLHRRRLRRQWIDQQPVTGDETPGTIAA